MKRLLTGTRRGVAALALTGSLSMAGGCAPPVSLQDEVVLGQQTAAQIAQEMPLVQDAAINRYINGLGNEIARRADPRGIQYTFYVVDAPEVNAFAIPGGHVYVNRGLITRTRNVSELAGVLGHEIGHVVNRHGITQWQRAQQANMGLSVLYGVLLGRAPSGLEQAGIQVGGSAIFAGYGRDAEREADATAIQYLIAAGYDPRGLVSMFETLIAEQRSNPGAVAQWFSTHPTTQERIDNTRAAIGQVPAGTLRGLTVNTQNYNDFRNRVARLR
jgi:beta-barrel assembly-enhancing protease